MAIATERTSEERSDQDGVDEEVIRHTNALLVTIVAPSDLHPPPQVFKKAYIPRTLTEVSHYERDVDLMRTKEEESAVCGHNDNVRETRPQMTLTSA